MTTPDNSKPLPSAPSKRKFSAKSTATVAQEQRIVEEGFRRGSLTTDDCRNLGVYQVSARIFGLRSKGYVIETELFNGYAADGYSHARMARYHFVYKPMGVAK